MPHGLTRKLDYEKAKRQANANKPDYRERIQEEGDNFNRGGNPGPRFVSFSGKTMTFSLLPAYAEDKASLLETLETQVRFTIAGEVGTISKLRKNSKVAADVVKRFEVTRTSIARADTIVGTARHPKKNREYPVVEFRCCLQPVEPFQNPIFKRLLAFRAIFKAQRQTD